MLQNSLGRTPLGIASAVGARSIVRELVLAGADVNDIQEQEGITSLACATMGGHMGVVKDLLIYGALPNGPLDYIEGDYEQTSSLFLPLHCAVSYKFPQIAKILKQHGALLQLRSVRRIENIQLQCKLSFTCYFGMLFRANSPAKPP